MAGAGESREADIIRLLRQHPGEYTSGAAISRELGVSRAAVWKHIEALRGAGYTIEAAPAKGYRLAGPAPFGGVEISSTLDTDFVARELRFLDSTDSTNSRAFELGRSGAPEGAAVVADAQTGGRGRLGRSWVSPPGVNLYTSVVLRPPIAPQQAGELTFVAAVAAAEAIGEFTRTRPSVKWPNDILIDGRKAAGILLEMDSEADRVHFVVVGVGVNVNMDISDLPPEVRSKATTVREKAGGEVSRTRLAAVLYSKLEKWYKVYVKRGFAPVAEAWRGYFPSEGKPVRVEMFGRRVEGICMGIDASGALLVRTPGGEVERVVSGDMAPGAVD